MNNCLDTGTLSNSLAELADRDADLAAVMDRFGPPLPRRRPQGFATLVLLILEQQVSLSSAAATFRRLEALCHPLIPETVLARGDGELRGAGLSRQKARYCRALAEAVLDGRVDLDGLEEHDDDAVRETLVQVPGIGQWTAEIYLLSALGRPDIFPARDLALQIAAQEIKGLEQRPGERELRDLAEAWRPWRTVAARVLWHHYRHTRNGQGDMA